MDMKNLKRQHTEVIDLANYVMSNVKNNTIEENIDTIVKSINTLSGKLKIHMLNEDKYLYPELLKHGLSSHFKEYADEMRSVTLVYEDYKLKYNTGSKIKQNVKQFEASTIEVFEALLNRIDKEDAELYPLLG